MLREAWRLQPDHFWTADLSGVDWPSVLDRYLPLVERVATRAELSDLIWELQGELGTSHCYEAGWRVPQSPAVGLGPPGRRPGPGCLRADGWWPELARGSSWYPREATPLARPGANVQVGDGHPGRQRPGRRRRLGPGAFAGQPGWLAVELTVAGPATRPGSDGAGRRTVVVPTSG